MPSFTIHEAVAKEMNKELKKDDLLFTIGSIAPDCWRNATKFGYEDRTLSHFTNKELNKDNEDYELFYKKYNKYLDDPFYLGYLLHLITDTYWRDTIYPEYHKLAKEGVKREDIRSDSHYIDQELAKYYKFSIFDTANINIHSNIEELDLTGLNGTLNYVNEVLSKRKSGKSKYITLDITIRSVNRTIEYIKKELERLSKIYD